MQLLSGFPPLSPPPLPPFFLMSNRYDHKIIAATSLAKPACPSNQSAVWDRPWGCSSGETTQRLSHVGGPNSRARQMRAHTGGGWGGSEEGTWDSSCIQRAGVPVFKEIEITEGGKKGRRGDDITIITIDCVPPHRPSTLIVCLLASHRAN